MPAPVPTKASKPNALEIFTDRIEEQKLLREILSPQPSQDLGARVLLTQFYGVGGVGKSTLYLRALEIAANDYEKNVTVIATSFDDNRWGPSSPFTDVLAELCRCLVEQKIIPELTVVLLALHGQQTGRNGESVGGLDAGWQMAFTAMEKGADLTGIPGLGMVVKSAQWVRERSKRQTLRQRLVDLGLWPEEAYGKLNLLDLEKKLSTALYYDLVDWLKAHPRQHLRLLLDGFERLQSSERKEDAQRRLQELIGYFSGQDNRDACDRFRTVIFGRNMLRWDEIYDDPSWREYWNLHILGGLAEADARDFLSKTRTWFAAKGQTALNATLLEYEERMLDAADETVGVHRVFYPFYLKLAVELVERAHQTGKEFELGRAPAELQDRFFRYLEPRELRALMVLSLSEVFDEELFDWLAKERLIEYSQHSFHSQLRREHSYIQAVEGKPGEWRFHRIMEDALHARWHSTAELKKEGANLIKSLLNYYAVPLLQDAEARNLPEPEALNHILSRDDSYYNKLKKSKERGTAIIIKQGPKAKLLDYETWLSLMDSKPWSLEDENHKLSMRSLWSRSNYFNAADQLYRYVIQYHEEKTGPSHPRTLASLNILGSLLLKKGDIGEAEEIFLRALNASEKELGPEHPNSLISLNNLGIALIYRGKHNDAETSFRRAWLGRRKVLGPEDEDTRASSDNLLNLLRHKGDLIEATKCMRVVLADQVSSLQPETLRNLDRTCVLLCEKGDLISAEELYRYAVNICEEKLGLEHPDTLKYIYRLATFLNDKSDLVEAEKLFRKLITAEGKAYGDESERICWPLHSLGDVLNKKGDSIGARQAYSRALTVREKTLGRDHPRTVKSLRFLTSIVERDGDIPEVITLLRRYANTNVGLKKLRYDLARCECLHGNIGEAKKLIADEIESRPSALKEALQNPDFAALHEYIKSIQPT